jgi:GNAT superfamily N-acetyltransferase
MFVEPVGPGGVILKPITSSSSPDISKLVDLFKTIFSEYDNYIRYLYLSADRANAPRSTTHDHVWMVEQEGRAVAFRLFSYLPNRQFGFGAYTGVLPEMRGLGIGRWLMAQTLAQVLEDANTCGHDDPLGCCVEIMRATPQQDAAEQARHTASLAFHLGCGARLLDVPYRELEIGWDEIQAGVTDLEGVPKYLAMYFPPGRERLSQRELIQVVEGIYMDIYLQPADHPVMRRVVDIIRAGGES